MIEDEREDMACHLISGYGRSKGQSEQIVNAWGSLSGHRALVLRAGSFLPHGMVLVDWVDAERVVVLSTAVT